MLTIDNVVTSYGMIKALKGVNLTAESGKVTCLLGPNGAGKTTLMFTIAGILKTQEGSITFDGTELSRFSPVKIVELGISLVPENRLVFPMMTVRENLELGAATRKGKKAINEDIEEVLELFPALRERQSRRAGSLSGGEQQQVGERLRQEQRVGWEVIQRHGRIVTLAFQNPAPMGIDFHILDAHGLGPMLPVIEVIQSGNHAGCRAQGDVAFVRRAATQNDDLCLGQALGEMRPKEPLRLRFYRRARNKVVHRPGFYNFYNL